MGLDTRIRRGLREAEEGDYGSPMSSPFRPDERQLHHYRCMYHRIGRNTVAKKVKYLHL